MSTRFTSPKAARSQKNMQTVSDFATSAAEPLLAVKDVAEWLGVSRLTIYRLVARQLLPFYRFCRHLRFKPEDVNAYLDRNQLNHEANDYASKEN